MHKLTESGKNGALGRTRKGYGVPPGVRAGTEKWGPEMGARVWRALNAGLRTGALLCGWWVTTEGFRRIHLAVVCGEEKNMEQLIRQPCQKCK